MNRFVMPFRASTLRQSLSKCSGQARASRSTQHERNYRFPVRPRIKYGASSEHFGKLSTGLSKGGPAQSSISMR